MNKRAWLGALAFLLLFAAVGVYWLWPSGAAPVSGNVANFNVVNYGTPLTNSGDYQIMDLQYNGSAQSGADGTKTVSYYTNKQLHATNPNVKLLMYAESMDSLSNSDWTSCVPYAAWSLTYNGVTYSGSGANANENYFLHDTTSSTDGPGNRIVDATATRFIMDENNPNYQTECYKHTLARAASNGFDGVFFDDMSWFGWYKWYDYADASSSSSPTRLALSQFKQPNASENYTQNCPASTYSASNPCDWEKGVASFAAAVAPKIQSIKSLSGQPLLVIGNTGPSTGGNYQAVLGPLDGYMEESWLDGNAFSNCSAAISAGYTCNNATDLDQDNRLQQVPYWSQNSSIANWAANNGKYALLHNYESTEVGNTYGLAGALLFDNGKTSYTTSNNNYSSGQTWFGEYCTAQQLGAPTSAYTTFTSGSATLYKRTFANGMVIVNPTANSSATVSLGGSYSYATSSLGSTACPSTYPATLPVISTSSVTLSPVSAYILYKSGSSTLIGDLNGDGHVNIFDLSLFLSHWQQTGTALPEDFNNDGVVNIFDLSMLLKNYGT